MNLKSKTIIDIRSRYIVDGKPKVGQIITDSIFTLMMVTLLVISIRLAVDITSITKKQVEESTKFTSLIQGEFGKDIIIKNTDLDKGNKNKRVFSVTVLSKTGNKIIDSVHLVEIKTSDGKAEIVRKQDISGVEGVIEQDGN